MKAKAIMQHDRYVKTRKIYQFPDYFLATFDTISGRPKSAINTVDGVMYSRRSHTLRDVIEDLKKRGYRRIA